jgi:transposase
MRTSSRASSKPVRSFALTAGVRTVRHRRDFGALEARRFRAADMFSRGATQADVARELGVSRPTALEWYRKWSDGGKKALRTGTPTAAGREGHGQGPEGYADRSRGQRVLPRAVSVPRVADVIEAVTGVTYHPGHVCYILRSMGWSRQHPARRAIGSDADMCFAFLRHRGLSLRQKCWSITRGS